MSGLVDRRHPGFMKTRRSAGPHENHSEGHIIVNSLGSATEQIGSQEWAETGPVSCPDQPSLLRAELEASRRELGRANRRIARFLRDRKRSRLRISRLETMATTDVVTQLVNRRRFDQALEAEFGLAVIRDTPLSVVMVDVDCFKFYNDTFGHPAGDVVLCVVARHLVKSARPTDVVARYGGDEFAILLRGADAVIAQNCCERYHDAITSFPWPKRPVTTSFGVATRTPSIADAASLVEEADRALYQSKRGRQTRVLHVGFNGASEASTPTFPQKATERFWVPRDADSVSPLEWEGIERPNLRKGR